MANIAARQYLLDLLKRPSSTEAYGRLSDGCLVSSDLSRTVASTKLSLHVLLPHEEASSIRVPESFRDDSAPSLCNEFLPNICVCPEMIAPPPKYLEYKSNLLKETLKKSRNVGNLY